MKKLLTIFLMLGLLVPGTMGVAAQSDTTGIATGLDSPAAYIDERGDVVATVRVLEIEEEWTDYNEYSAPSAGIVYRAVHFSVTNETDRAIIVEPYDFTLVDDMGRNNSRSWVSIADDASVPMFEDDLPMSANETVELMLVFEMYDDIFPSVFVWQPDSGKLVMVDLQPERSEDAAYAEGMNAPATWTDDRMRPMARIQVTSVERDWQEYADNYAPETGMEYVAVNFSVENVSNSNLIIEPYDLSLVDAEGNNSSRAWVRVDEGAAVALFEEDAPLSAGDTLEGTVVFQTVSGVTPAALLWQPDSGILNIVNLGGEGESTPGSATPVADDATEEASQEATSESGSTRPRRTSGSQDSATEEAATGTASGTAVEVDGKPLTIVDAVNDELGTVRVVATQDGWDEYRSNDEPDAGTHFYLVTVEVELVEDNPSGQYVSVLDFTLITEDGTEIASDLYLNADDAEVRIDEGGTNLKAGESGTFVIPFVINDGDVPVEIKWNTGNEEVILNLAP